MIHKFQQQIRLQNRKAEATNGIRNHKMDCPLLESIGKAPQKLTGLSKHSGNRKKGHHHSNIYELTGGGVIRIENTAGELIAQAQSYSV